MIEMQLSETSTEKTIVQGIADCVFEENGELVILDFKTDRVKDVSELVDMYKPQLDIYAHALSEIDGVPVKECILYSLCKNEAVSVSPTPVKA